MTQDEILAQFGPREAMEYDVIVVGGGPAGLSTRGHNAAAFWRSVYPKRFSF